MQDRDECRLVDNFIVWVGADAWPPAMNAPIPFPPADLDNQRDPRLWTCELCGAEMLTTLGRAPGRCYACGQEPLVSVQRRIAGDWGA